MKLEKIWCVSKPYNSSYEMVDILWPATPLQFGLQFKGGLLADDELAFYDNEAEATADARARLAAVKETPNV